MYPGASRQLAPLAYQFPPSPICSSSSIPTRDISQASKNPSPGGAAPLLSGLRTPPSDDMGTTYQAPNIGQHDANPYPSLNGYSGPRSRSSVSNGQAVLDSYPRYHQYATQASGREYQMPATQQSQQQPSQVAQPQPIARESQHTQATATVSYAPQTAVAQPSRASTPKSSGTVASQVSMSQKDVASLAGQSLEIPMCISTRGGSLSVLAAQMTTFFWFEPCPVHHLAEKLVSSSPSEPVPSLNALAIPTPEFKSWVHSVLSTTQVTQNVILLALLFIHRLKTTVPDVRGARGSEYRLLTVALMLGNKFLDDNTYTNKTWAEVSGITVKDIHVMEVEFLSNMRYSLLVSKAQWEQWLVKLSKFWEYCERATRPVLSPITIPSPTRSVANASIRSPTGHLVLTPTLHSTPTTRSPYDVTYAANNQWPAQAMPQTCPAVSGQPDTRNGFNKRPYADEDPTEPPSKRVAMHPQSIPAQPANMYSQARQRPAGSLEPLRLPVPNLTVNTTPNAAQAAYNSVVSHVPIQQSALSLPPMVPGVRAMATVYPSTTTASNFAGNVATSSVPTSVSTPLTTSAPGGFPPMTNYATPTKRHSPGSLTPAAAAALGNSSPLSESFAHGQHGVRTPISQSPSVYLQHRSSPYRPVRHVNTLLCPPPSSSLHEYHLSGPNPAMVAPAQMHYQPLGRRHEYHTGIVPEFTLSAQQQQAQAHYARQEVPMPPTYRQIPGQAQMRPVVGHNLQEPTHSHMQFLN
ncbi:hypothetical protein PpBr36_03300 [Pyricularia pennisetigena]|uniref:hypothetical protein n=1 Tax=Pyricularia pennisetigena TaxID=1578925 RepID=UPI0011501499|nr:hypothetical protein PpBr36_03300 [Pyricularia pennisetigena]TLS30788.1 hypothetical protein PpBr36_03300 [Pyricularia pennisetigena]